MEQRVFQVDAFSDRAFAGNPAAVCPMEVFPDERLLQSIAAEMNLAETAFFVPLDASRGHYHLRWFTPAIEVQFCGHATLASAFIIFRHMAPKVGRLTFKTLIGTVYVQALEDGRLQLDLPNLKPAPMDAPEGLADAMGAAPVEVLDANTGDDDLLLVYDRAETILGLRPDPARMAALSPYGFIATAPGQGAGDADFVSRCFFPNKGIPEDPVTGSAHCAAGPYWAKRLGRRQMFARQVSARGGDLWLHVGDERVLIAGHAVEVLQGTLLLPDK